MSYERYYPGGWQSGEAGATPITPEALNHMEDGIANSVPGVESSDHPGCYYRIVNGETEWINPPMVVTKEYRTTERRDGKSVYAKRVSYIPASDITGTMVFSVKHNISNFGSLVRIVGRSGVYTIPYFALNGRYTGFQSVTATDINVCNNNENWSAGNSFYFDLYYTKTTD